MGRKKRTQREVDDHIIEQLESSYDIDDNGCWIWTGAYFGSGYPRISRHLPIASFHYRARIASYQYHKGEIPKGIFVCHECDVRGCINPDHLWLGTNQDNQLDAVKKGAFEKYWTKERRAEKSKQMSGTGNPMHGKKGDQAPCYGRTGKKHPMFGKKHTSEAKLKISNGLKKGETTCIRRSHSGSRKVSPGSHMATRKRQCGSCWNMLVGRSFLILVS